MEKRLQNKTTSSEKDSKYNPNNDLIYKEIKEKLPLGESLEDVVVRVEETLNLLSQKQKKEMY